MKIRLADHLVQKLSKLGKAIDIDRPTQVFDGGEVGLVDDQNEKESGNERQRTGGPAAGSWQGAEAGPRRTSGQAGNSVGRLWPQWLIDDQLTLLLSSYPGSRVFLFPSGCWLKVPLSPLGVDGPRALLLIALPSSKAIHPRCWSFWVKPLRIDWVGPRHTNYPFGDACAFPQFEGHWERIEGLRAYVDIHAEWLIRQLFLSAFDYWPGRQMSPFALYSLTQFGHDEHCHCQSSRRYGECCRRSDLEAYRANPTQQTRVALKFTANRWFGNQRPPVEISGFALGHSPPDISTAMSWFNEQASIEGRTAILRHRLRDTTSATQVKLRSTPVQRAA